MATKKSKRTYNAPKGTKITGVEMLNDGKVLLTFAEDVADEFKRGDILSSDGTILIFDKYISCNRFSSLLHNRPMFSSNNWYMPAFRYASIEEIDVFYKDLARMGKKWNEETLEIEDLDISEIVVDLESACEYLDKTMPIITSIFTSLPLEDYGKFHAQITLQLIREAWNKFDRFVVDWDDARQPKYCPVIDSDGSVTFKLWSTGISMEYACYSFRRKKRALQFGTQFKELFKTAMGD